MRLSSALGIAVLLCAVRDAAAITITGYAPAVNDRFTAGYPAAPQPNTAPSFIGLPYDWSGVGWNAAAPWMSFGFVTPRHFLVSRHVGGAATIALQGADGVLHTATQAAVIDTGYGLVLGGAPGDLAVGRLVAPLPADWAIARYPVLDLNPTSMAGGSYDSQPLLVYGGGAAGPRIGPDVVMGTRVAGSDSFITSSLNTVQLEAGDSGSPVFVPWTTAGGAPQLAIVGNNAAVGGANFHNLAASSPVLAAINAITVRDGFALALTGEPAATWRGGEGGGAGADLGTAGNWTPAVVPTDQFAAFSGTAAHTRAIEVNAGANLRGLVFQPTGSGTLGFTFTHAAHVLTLGRGGIVNADGSRQVFTAALALGDHQVWDVGPGGVTAGPIDTRGHLLEIMGTGTAVVAGPVSGSGGLALSGHRLELTGANSYTGTTWVHAGTLVVSGSMSASAGVVVAPGATVAGTGRLPGVAGGGTVDPGPNAGTGILAAAGIDGTAGLGFDLDFTRPGAPDWAAGAASGNDVLRLTGSTPFAAALAPANRVRVFLDGGALAAGTTFLGGFFTDRDADFLPSIAGAAFAFLVPDATGTTTHGGRTYAAYTGPLTFSLATVPVTATFAGGTETGFVMEIRTVPEPDTAPLAGACLLVLLRRCRGRRRGTLTPALSPRQRKMRQPPSAAASPISPPRCRGPRG